MRGVFVVSMLCAIFGMCLAENSSWCSEPFRTSNYVQDPGFESGKPWALAGASIIPSSQTGGCGSNSLQVPLSDQTTVSQKFSVSASGSQNFSISTLVKGDEASFSDTPQLTFFDKQCSLSVADGSYDWQPASFICTVDLSNTDSNLAWVFPQGGSGNLYFDNVRVCYFGDGSCYYEVMVGKNLYNDFSLQLGQDVEAATIGCLAGDCYQFANTAGATSVSFPSAAKTQNYWTTLHIVASSPARTGALSVKVGDDIVTSFILTNQWKDYSTPIATASSIPFITLTMTGTFAIEYIALL